MGPSQALTYRIFGGGGSVYSKMNSIGGFAPFWCAPYLDPAQTNQCSATCGDSLKASEMPDMI